LYRAIGALSFLIVVKFEEINLKFKNLETVQYSINFENFEKVRDPYLSTTVIGKH